MMPRGKRNLSLSIVAAGVLGMSTVAQAEVYAVAYNNIVRLEVTSTAPDGSGGPFYIFLPNFTDFTAFSGAAAQLDGAGDPAAPANSDSAGGPVDALPSYGLGSVFVPAPPANNNMAPLGQVGNYSRSDAQVSQTTITQESIGGPILPTLQNTQTWGIAETRVEANGFALAASIDGSETGLNTQIELKAPARFAFSLEADPYLAVSMGLGAAGGTANANIDTTFTITSGGTTVFEWAPDGSVTDGIILGGEEFEDEAPLNGSIEVTSPGDSVVYNPNNPGSPADVFDPSDTANVISAGTINPVNTRSYRARTNILPAGVYTLALDVSQNVNVRTALAPPVYDLGDNPDPGAGNGPGNYQTVTADGGARHQISGPYLGFCVDVDDGTLQDVAATEDDLIPGSSVGTCALRGDEDGVDLPASVVQGGTYSAVINMPAGASASACSVDGWIDFNSNGVFEAGEKIVEQSFGAGSGATPVSFTVPADAIPGFLYSRFRCSSEGDLPSTGDWDNGEVEDYRQQLIVQTPIYDLGDNPDTGAGNGPGNYQTVTADGGARHEISGPYLGSCVDADDGTLQNMQANADDATDGTPVGTCVGRDDEDGVILPSSVVPGQSYNAIINMPLAGSSADCNVDGWMDFNGNGVFEASEKIVEQLFNAGSGATPVSFTVPEDAIPGFLYSRFRCSSEGGLPSTGDWGNGEVEDYQTSQKTRTAIPTIGFWGLALLAMLLAALVAVRRQDLSSR